MNFFDNLLQDLRFALRQLRASLIFTCTAVIVLAIGMAASVAIFAFIDAALIRPLPYRNPSRLVGVFGRIPLFPQSNLSYPDYIDLKKLNIVFNSLEAYRAVETCSPIKTARKSCEAPASATDFFEPWESLRYEDETSIQERTCPEYNGPSC